MRFVALLLVWVGLAHALTIQLKRGIEKGRPYEVLHLIEADPFKCQAFYDEEAKPSLFACTFHKHPVTRLEPIKTEFFSLTFGREKAITRLRIEPIHQGFLQPLPPPIYRKHFISVLPLSQSSHWIVVGYEGDAAPLLGKKPHISEGLIFPIDFSTIALPSVGAVDLKGEPVFVKEKQDVERFMEIKAAFNAKRYKKAYDLATEAMETFRDSIFMSDFLRYRIKALVAEDIKEYADEAIKLGRAYLKQYASEEYVPEVLLLLARVYSATGFVSDATYFFNRLIQEHPQSRYADLGLIYLGDQLYMNGKSKEAMESYLKAYYKAKDLDVATLAAYKLAIRFIQQGKMKEAVRYLQKIFKKNRDFLFKDIADAHEIALELAARRYYNLAIEINKEIVKRIRKIDEPYEKALFEIAEWYKALGKMQEAIRWYRRYLSEFEYGDYSDEAKKALDELFVVQGDANITKALQRFEMLMRKYKDQEIAYKALVAKIKLLVRAGRYKEALSLRDLLSSLPKNGLQEEAKKALLQAANALLNDAIDKGLCQEALALIKNYQLPVNHEKSAFIFSCQVQFSHLKEALQIAQKALSDAKGTDQEVWLCRIESVLLADRQYYDAYKALEELKTISKNPERICPKLEWDAVKIYHAMGYYAKEMAAIRLLYKKNKDDIRLSELYKLGYESAKRAGDEGMQVWLLRQLIALQNRSGAHPYSPWAEFTLMGHLKKAHRYQEALKIAKQATKLSLDGEAAARLQYELARLYQQLNQKKMAKRTFQKCADIQGGGAWKTLCLEALSLEAF